jgi:hypothetical protein
MMMMGGEGEGAFREKNGPCRRWHLFLVLEFASTQKSGFYMGKVLSLRCVKFAIVGLVVVGKMLLSLLLRL